jgi:hypothetical protein
MRGWPVAPLDSGDHGSGNLVSGGTIGIGKLPNLPPLQLFGSELIPDLGAELRFGGVQVPVQGVNQLFEFPYRSLGENNPGIPGVIDVVDQLGAVHDVTAGSRSEDAEALSCRAAKRGISGRKQSRWRWRCSCTDITSSNTKVLGLTA